MSPLGRLWAFTSRVYAPGLHVAYAAFWFLALDGALSAAAGRDFRPGVDAALAIASNFLVLFFLRVLDEIKDLDYDRRHNPDRPLVSGLVTVSDLVGYLTITAVLVALVNTLLSPLLLAIAIADLAWGVALVFVERAVPRVRDHMGWNLLVTYPVNVLLSVYTYAFFVERQGAASTSGLLLLGAFTLAFLTYEIGRKTKWPRDAEPGERLYSRALGVPGAAALALGCALGATTLALAVFTPWREEGARAAAAWAQLVPAIPAAIGTAGFLAGGRTLKPFALGFLFLFYIALVGLAAV